MSANASSSSEWPTPASANGRQGAEDPSAKRERSSKSGLMLTDVSVNWPTPTVRDHKGGGTALVRSDGKIRNDMLDWVAEKWATPQARDYMPAHSPERIAAMKALGHGMRNLNDEAAMWTTPCADDTSTRTKKFAQGGTPLSMQANQASTRSTPRATDGEKGGPNQSFGAGGIPLPAQTMQWDLARDIYSPLARVTVKTGKPHSKERRSLNPLFVEWLMGWPPGWTLLAWTDFACSATALSLFKQRMRFALSQLASPTAAPPAQLALFG
ncbi:hypothetical protein NKJ71_19550 [Mesorhizobium sp. M0050]|uniref:hypothetical protein n=1 Tax=Mesorhizobium sp. M0050 TaxID=2956861 RepID=UPI003334C582